MTIHVVTRELAQCPPLLAVHRLHPQRYPCLLESAAHGTEQGRHDVLFACPQGSLQLDGNLQLSGQPGTPGANADFLHALDDWWQQERVASAPPDLPFTGGWFLYLGYELAAQVEPTLRLPSPAPAPVALAVRFPLAVIRSCETGRVCLVAEPQYEHLVDTVLADLEALANADEQAATAGASEAPMLRAGTVFQEEPPERYVAAVERARQYIYDGDVFQANLSREWRGELAAGIDDAALYARLCRTNPGPFAGLMVWHDWAIISSSPERLLRVRGGVAETRPIAGTRPRGADATQDAALKEGLLAHPKERAEHIMLIDLERNDLGRICQPGTIDVDQIMGIESYAHVHHIVSNVRGILRHDVTPGDAIRAVFPGGTITGCPKVRCMEIIAELERRPRSAYTGSFGYLNRDGSMDLNILIRTFERQGRRLSLSAGAGIVADSVAEGEVSETRGQGAGSAARTGSTGVTKPAATCLVNGVPASAVPANDRGLAYGDGIFETLAVIDGHVRFLPRHLARLASACLRLEIRPPSETTLSEEVGQLASGVERAVLKIIITRGAGGRGYAPAADAISTRIMSLGAWPQRPAEHYRLGLKLIVCATRLARQPALAGLKTLNRLEQVLGRAEVVARGADEGLMLDDQCHVIEATAANLFAVCAGKLVTPRLDGGGVRGIMRDVVMETAGRQGIEVLGARLTLAQVLDASELFLTSSLAGILPVRSLGKVTWQPGALARQLSASLADHQVNLCG